MAVNIRYIVDDVDAAVEFYTHLLGFRIEMRPAPAFAILALGDLRLMLSGTGGPGGGAQAMPDGRRPEPGGWNRFQIEVDDLDGEAGRLRRAGARLRSDVIEGIGVRQVIVDDPSGNPVELFEPRRAQVDR